VKCPTLDFALTGHPEGCSPWRGRVIQQTAQRIQDGNRMDSTSTVRGCATCGKQWEHMIQKNPSLFNNTPCKVCCILLISESQKLAHYQAKSMPTK
uniref:Uncharacterized protein n=1 Tax=Canis lupus dingo TaxID=286419 RepID=A0A8C0KW96_CANLU